MQNAIDYLLAQPSIRIVVIGANGFGEEKSSLNLYHYLRKTLAYTGIIEILYDEKDISDIATLLNLDDTFIAQEPYVLDDHTVLISLDEFKANYNTYPSCDIAITANPVTSDYMPWEVKARNVIQIQSFLNNKNFVYLHYQSSYRSLRIETPISAIIHPTPTKQEALDSLQNLSASDLHPKQNGLLSLLNQVSEDVPAIPIYGMHTAFKSQCPAVIMGNLLEALTILHAKDPSTAKTPIFLYLFNDLSQDDVRSIQAIVKTKNAAPRPTLITMLDIKQADIATEINQCTAGSIYIINIGKVPAVVFDYLATASKAPFVPLIYEGASGLITAANAKRPGLWIAGDAEDNYEPEPWEQVHKLAQHFQGNEFANLMSQYTNALFKSKQIAGKSNGAMVADYLLALNNPNSAVFKFWQDFFAAYHNPDNNRLLSAVNMVLETGINRPALLSEAQYNLFLQALHQNDQQEFELLSQQYNAWQAPDVGLLPPMVLALQQNKLEWVFSVARLNSDQPSIQSSSYYPPLVPPQNFVSIFIEGLRSPLELNALAKAHMASEPSKLALVASIVFKSDRWQQFPGDYNKNTEDFLGLALIAGNDEFIQHYIEKYPLSLHDIEQIILYGSTDLLCSALASNPNVLSSLQDIESRFTLYSASQRSITGDACQKITAVIEANIPGPSALSSKFLQFYQSVLNRFYRGVAPAREPTLYIEHLSRSNLVDCPDQDQNVQEFSASQCAAMTHHSGFVSVFDNSRRRQQYRFLANINAGCPQLELTAKVKALPAPTVNTHVYTRVCKVAAGSATALAGGFFKSSDPNVSPSAPQQPWDPLNSYTAIIFLLMSGAIVALSLAFIFRHCNQTKARTTNKVEIPPTVPESSSTESKMKLN